MCRTVPRLVLRVDGQRAEVDNDGRPGWVVARAVPDLQPGEYVAVYAGAALERLPTELALELLSFEQELEQMLEEAMAASLPPDLPAPPASG